MKRRLLFTLGIALLLSVNQLPLYGFQAAQEGKKMSFQGTLFENGAPVTGERNFTFSIDLGEGASWTETQSNVQIIEGIYAVTLGSITPMPENLFFGVQGRTLTVSIGNTVLGTTELYSPFSSDDISSADDLPRRIVLENEDVDSDSIFYFRINADNVTQGSQKGLQVDMTGQGFKMALRGNTISQEGDESGAIAVIGSATGAGTGNHEGVRGQAFGAGKSNNGVLGLAGGPGNGGEGYEGDGSYNTGVMGYGQNNTWGNTGVTGYAVGTQGVDNIGVAGISTVGAEGDTEVENKGVLGRAEGLGINKAIWGSAKNGVENWAGWFEGDVSVRGGNNFSIFNNGDKRIELDYFDANDAGSILTFNHKNQRAALLGTASDRTGGLFTLYDSLENDLIQLRATSRPANWPTDKRPHGQLSLNGPDGQNIYMGAAVWEEGGANTSAFQMFGSPVEDTEGNFNTPEGIFMSVRDFGDGIQQGTLQLIKDGQRAILNKDNTTDLLNMVEGKGKYRFEVNEQNSGVLKMMSSVDSVNVLIDSNGPKAGLLQLNDSLGRRGLYTYAFKGGGAYLGMDASFPEIADAEGETKMRTAFQLAAGQQNPWMNMISRNPDGTVKGRFFAGGSLTGGNPSLTLTGATYGDIWARVQGNADNGGSIDINGPSTSNYWIGQKNWENSDLPFFAMRGQNTVPDGEGTRIPDGVSLEVSRYDDGSDVGALTLRRIANDQEETATLDFYQLNNLINPSSQRVLGDNGNEVARLERRGNNFGQGVFFNDINELRAEIGSFGDNSGFMQLYAPNGNKNIQMGGSDGARDYGMLKLFDVNGQDMFQFQTEDNNGNQVPFFRMGNVQNLDQNNYPKDALRAGISSDPNGDNKYSTYFNLEGPDSPLIHMGSHGWESNDGSNRARIALFGNDRDENNNVQERANISIAKDGAGTEFAAFNLSNTSGGGFEIGSRGWENGDQGGNLTYTAIKSTVDIDDGNGGTYRPWLVTQEFHQDENGNQYGTVRLNSTNNTGFVNINDGNSGNIDISGSLNQSSDRRLKKNVSTLTSGLSMVNKLRGVRYNWKDETRTENKIGFIAQEVEEVLPELVKTRENGFKGVNYAEMTAVLVEAVKELSAQVEELKAQNTELKAEASKVSDMEERLAKIEALLLNNAKSVNADQKQ